MADEVTIGEVYRLVQALKEEHGEKLDAIDTQVRLTNGRTTRLETQVGVLNREVRDLKQNRQTPASLPVVTPDGESLSIKISPRMWALIATAFTGLSMFGPILRDWLAKLFGN